MLWSLRRSISIQTALLTLSLLASLLPSNLAFSFSYSAPTQCGDLTVKWDGGTPPFRLQITPPFSVPHYFSIPSSSFSNGKGSYTLQLQLNASDTFLMTMSDATGFGSGGTSDLLTVGGNPTNTNCNLTEPIVDFIFITENALVQCRPYLFNGYAQAQGPITVTGLIPLGNSFVLKPPPSNSSFTWTANVKSGTRIVFFITDSAGRQGGATDLMFVGASDGTSCLSADSPASTAQSQTILPTGTGTGTPQPTDGSGSGPSGGVIGGAVAGGLIAIIAVVSLVWFFMRKRRRDRDTPHVSAHFSKRRSANIDLLPEDGHYPLPRGGQDGNNNYEPIPFVLPDSQSNSDHMSASGLPPSRGPGTTYSASTAGDYPPGHPGYGWNNGRASTVTDPNPQGYAISSSQGRSSKQAYAFANTGGQPSNVPARFVLHTDGGELPDTPNEQEEEEEEIVELPPQYSSLTPAQRRASQRQAQGYPGGSGRAGPSS